MKLKNLENILNQVKGFEQYDTPSSLASQMLYFIKDDLEEKFVLELGLGSGILSIGSSLLGSQFNLAIEIDPQTFNLSQYNFRNLLSPDLYPDIIQADVLQLNFIRPNIFDVIIMNPPFGTKNNPGLDLIFLIQSFKFLMKKAAEWNMEFEVIAELKWPLSNTYAFHKLISKDIEVDLLKFSKKK